MPKGGGRPENSHPRLTTALREALDEDETLERLKAVALEHATARVRSGMNRGRFSQALQACGR